MGMYYLKCGDVGETMEVALLKPNGQPFDLAGSTAWKLNIWLADGTKLIRDMTKYGTDAAGILHYTSVATDWDPGQLVAVSLPLPPGQREHLMEYEVLGPGTRRLTFPNGGYDTLRILPDIAG